MSKFLKVKDLKEYNLTYLIRWGIWSEAIQSFYHNLRWSNT